MNSAGRSLAALPHHLTVLSRSQTVSVPLGGAVARFCTELEMFDLDEKPNPKRSQLLGGTIAFDGRPNLRPCLHTQREGLNNSEVFHSIPQPVSPLYTTSARRC